MALESKPRSFQTASRVLSALAVLAAVAASALLLAPAPLADVFFSGIVLLSVGFALVAGFGAWTGRTALAWVGALLLTGLAIAGMMSIGFLIAPAALLSLGAAVASQLAGPRPEHREAIVANPPTVPEAVAKTLAGSAFVTIGAGAVYTGAFRQELFQACARETLDCTLANTHWDAVGLSLLGLGAVSLGSWLVWTQVYASRVLTSTQSG